MSTQNREMHI